MALNFPDNPSVNQIFSDATSGFYYKWDGYVWQSFSPGSSANIQILDDVSGSFNGIATSFSLSSNGNTITPINSQQLVINLGGVVQDPSDDYAVSGSNIIFSTAPNNGLTFSGISLGPAIPISNILDGSIVPQDLSTGSPWWQSDYKVGIGTTIPTSLLDVEGNVIIAGITTINAGLAGTALVVQGNARITGILTVGTASITFNGNTNRLNIGSGIILDGNDNKINVGSAITFNGSTGIISATEFRGNGANLTGVQPFQSGTAIIFAQTSAPVGWTKSTTHHNKALRVVNTSGGGSGGSVGFTTAFTSRSGVGTVASTTLTTTQIPSHSHTYDDTTGIGNGGGQSGPNNPSTITSVSQSTSSKTSGNSGGGSSHNHGFSLTMDFDVEYVDTLICTKD